MRGCKNSPEMFEKERKMKSELEKWVLIEESILKQKSRIQWMKLGDANTTYFHVSMKSRVSINMMRSLQNSQGDMVHTEKEITEEVLQFYRSLLGSNASQLPAINHGVMRKGPVLDRSYQLGLIQPVTREEVWRALQNIDDQKAPGEMD